jgi:hypothetical protein
MRWKNPKYVVVLSLHPTEWALVPFKGRDRWFFLCFGLMIIKNERDYG